MIRSKRYNHFKFYLQWDLVRYQFVQAFIRNNVDNITRPFKLNVAIEFVTVVVAGVLLGNSGTWSLQRSV